jgi:hypothetical protein
MKHIIVNFVHVCIILMFAGNICAERPANIDDVVIPEGYEITNLGTAVTQIATLNGYLADNIHYIFSRNTIPGELLGYDVDKGEISTQIVIKLGDDRSNAARSMVHIGDELFIGATFESNERRLSIIRLNPVTGDYYEAAKLHPALIAHAMTASPDGMIYVSTSQQYSANVYEFNPETEDGRWLGSFQTQGRQDAPGLAACEDYVYVGVGLEAPDLWKYNRITQERVSIFPDEMRNVWLDVNTVVLHDDWVIAGGSGPVSEPIIVLVNREDPSIYRLVNHGHGLIQSSTINGDKAYFGSGEGVWEYNIATDEINRITGMAANRGLFYRGGVLHGTDNRRNIGMYDLETGKLTVIDLGRDAGAREWPEPGQSMIYSDGVVYVGGHHSLGMHDIKNGTSQVRQAPGEAKHMVTVPNRRPTWSSFIYWGAYSSGVMVRYDPDLRQTDVVASTPTGDNRPRAVAYDEVNKYVLLGAQSDRFGAGSLTIYDIENDRSEYIIDPFGDHSVSAVASLNGIAYLGSAQGRVDPATNARVAAWNPVTREKIWEGTPVQGESRIRSLVAVGDNIMGLTPNGHFFVIEPTKPEILYSKQIFTDSRYDTGRLVVRGEMVIAVSENEIRRIDPETFKDEVFVTELRSQWFHWPTAAIDDEGNVYALMDLDLVKISEIKPTDSEKIVEIPDKYVLEQNYPNPFNPATTIRYSLPEQSHVTIEIFSITGQHIATLVDESQAAGRHHVDFDAGQLTSGVYLYRMQANGISATKKLTLIK